MRVAWGNYRLRVILILLGKVGSLFKLLILCEEAFVIEVSYRCLGRGDVSLLGEKTWPAARINPRRSSSGSSRSSRRSCSSREVEVYGVGEKAAMDPY